MLRILVASLLCAVSMAASAAESLSLAQVQHLAAQPLALVNGNRCEVQGAVLAGTRPRAGVRLDLISASGQIFKARTNAEGVYRASLPFAGTTTAYRERIADPIRVPTELAHQARVIRPAFVCSQELTKLIFAANTRGK